ncbi:MAG: hypothetical protein RL701_5878 [Pseudomonadota bacterium]|jgi:hypothetical protein
MRHELHLSGVKFAFTHDAPTFVGPEIQAVPTMLFMVNEAGALEHTEVIGNSRRRQVQSSGDVSGVHPDGADALPNI